MNHLILPAVVLLAAAAAVAQTSPAPLPAAGEAKSGQVVGLPIAALADVPTLPVKIKAIDGPPFLFSDAPEYFPGDGISLREDVAAGRARFMIYHCPENTARRSTITAVVENRGTAPMTLRLPRYSFPKPSLYYQAIGRTGMVDFLSNRPGPADRVVPPGGRVLLDPAMDATTVVRDELVHAFGEFEVDQPARFIVLQRPTDAKTLDVLDSLPVLPTHRDGAGRGTFAKADFAVTLDAPVDLADGPRQLVVADGKTDPWITGRDGTNGAAIKNVGNYGVLYHFKFDVAHREGKRVALLLVKPQADEGYCPATTAAVTLRVGDGKPSVVALPETGMLRQFPQGALIGVVTPSRDKPTTVELTYTPPAASCLATPILLVPID